MRTTLLVLSLALLPLVGVAQSRLPSVTLQTMDGKKVDSQTWTNDGHPIIVNFWATWCAPCKRELTAIAEKYEDWQTRTGVKLIAISIDDARSMARVAPYVNGQGWDYEVYLDPNGDLKRALNVNNVPHTFLLNGSGEIVYQHNNYEPGDENELFKQVLELTGKKVIFVPMRGITPAMRGLAVAILLLLLTRASAQEGGQIHGNFSTDAQYYNQDSAIGAVVPDQQLGINAWTNLIYTKGNFEAGARLESYEPALVGYPAGQPYVGSGVGYRYAKFKQDDLEITAGNFFEQFGQGMVFRSYEERYLGVDNAMDGVRLKYRPYQGVYLKGVIGRQRFGFDDGAGKGVGIVRGIDGEVSFGELLDSAWTCACNLIIGGSFVSKYQEDRDPLLELPENVGSWALRANLTTPRWNLYTEYAYKINDPNNKNGFIYKPGQALLVNATYSVKGFGASIGAHTFDNMFYQSDRTAPTPFDLNINFLPPLTKQHTYNLPATLYPYATQPNGEVSAQGEVFRKWKKGTPLGGKYGTKLAVNYSVAYSLDTTQLGAVDDTTSRLGYSSNFFMPGDRMYFQDFNVELRKKVSEDWELALTYLNIVYDIDIIQGKPGKPHVYADIVILEGLHNFNDRNSLRFELQHLSTEQDHGNWATAVAEFTFSPHWFLAAQDQYNYGGSVDVEETHYPIGSVGYIRGGNRFQMNYGRQRAGIFCVGGVCRQVPAANGLTLSITTTF